MKPLRDPRRHLVFLSPVGFLGGAERGLLNLLEVLPESHRATVVVGGPGPLEEAAEARGAAVERLLLPGPLARLSRRSGAGARARALPAGLGYLGRLRSRLRALGPDLLWSNGVKMHLLTGLAAGGRTWVAHMRELGCPAGVTQLIRWRRAWVVGNSSASAAAAGAPAARSRVLPNAIPVARLRRAAPSRAAAREALGIAPEAFVVLCVGALGEHKGQRRLLEAFAALAAQEPRAELHLVGGEPYRTEGHGGTRVALEARAAALGLERRVRLFGEVPEPWVHYRSADLFALPSRSEGFGRAALEAAALGCPVVLTEVGGTREVFGDDGAELLDPWDEGAWAAALRRLAEDPEGRGARARAGYAVARRHDLRALRGALGRVLGEIGRGAR